MTEFKFKKEDKSRIATSVDNATFQQILTIAREHKVNVGIVMAELIRVGLDEYLKGKEEQ